VEKNWVDFRHLFMAESNENTRFLTKDDLAAILGITRSGVECLMKSRRIPYTKIGTHVRFRLDRVMQALDGFEVRAMKTK
jgi:excisionase family DNA binding protein